MRRHRFIDLSGQRDPVKRISGRQFGDLSQYLAATARLLAQQFDILGKG
jgi:hypothetical protein